MSKSIHAPFCALLDPEEPTAICTCGAEANEYAASLFIPLKATTEEALKEALENATPHSYDPPVAFPPVLQLDIVAFEITLANGEKYYDQIGVMSKIATASGIKQEALTHEAPARLEIERLTRENELLREAVDNALEILNDLKARLWRA